MLGDATKLTSLFMDIGMDMDEASSHGKESPDSNPRRPKVAACFAEASSASMAAVRVPTIDDFMAVEIDRRQEGGGMIRLCLRVGTGVRGCGDICR